MGRLPSFYAWTFMTGNKKTVEHDTYKIRCADVTTERWRIGNECTGETHTVHYSWYQVCWE